MTIKPLLAYTITNPQDIRLPAYASIKLDGIRCIVLDGIAYSRTMKPIPNRHIQATIKHLDRYDGELIIGAPNLNSTYNTSVSGVMSQAGEPDFQFYVFDHFSDLPFARRLAHIQDNLKPCSVVRVLEQTLVHDHDTLLSFEAQALADSFEGIMVRSVDGPYKQNRSTAREQILGKLKRFSDSEAVVLGTYEEFENTNEATVDALGHTDRSTHAEGMVGKGTLGGLYVKDCVTGVEFKLGGGFTAAQRRDFYRQDLEGKILTYKFFAVGTMEKPRFPVWKGWRDSIDIITKEGN